MAEREGPDRRGTLRRPDLEEFLSALSGFVDKKGVSSPSGRLKFLDIFCRSVGSAEGHLLRPDAAARLESVASCNLPPTFDADFNAARAEASPLDGAYQQQRVVGIVEIKDEAVAPWFSALMKRHGYKALVAVPILSPGGPTGLLCAYYRDVCLFDQDTLGRLATVGRMLGGAERAPEEKYDGKTERRLAPDVSTPSPAPARSGAERAGEAEIDALSDLFAATLTQKPFTKVDVFKHLGQTAARALPGAAVLCGPVRILNGSLTLAVADVQGTARLAVTQRVALSAALHERLTGGRGPGALREAEQGELKAAFKSATVSVLCRPLLWQGKMQAALIAWRAADQPFGASDDRRLGRLAAIAALALNAV